MVDTDWEIEDYKLEKKSISDNKYSEIEYYDEVLCEVKIKLVRDFNKLPKTENEIWREKQKEIKPWNNIEEVCIGYGR